VVDEPTASETPSGLRPGSRFGHYRLKRLLGRGGYGEVYEAEDTLMDRAVALKLLAAPYSQNQAFRQRLYREARNAGKLHEPHVVPIHHCGEIDGQLYIDMRLIEGSDLQKVLALHGPLSPARAVAIVRQIAAALDAAHTVDMVHRDIKPANILLTGDDFACLVDFGLANASTDAHLTSSGTTIGTFAYMAPERFSNTDVSHRADIYALACVLYECLTGSLPYAAGDLPALINAHLTAPIPRPSQRPPQIPAAFDDVIAHGMAKAAKDRYASAGELARAAHHALSAPDQDNADAILADTQAAPAKPPASSPTKTRPPAKSPASSPTTNRAKPTPSPQSSQPPPARQKPKPPLTPERDSNRPGSGRRIAIGVTLVALLVLAALAVGRTVIRSDYYVTAYNGAVTIMQGIQLSILGAPLHQPYSQACLDSLNQLSVIRYGQAGATRDCQLMRLSDLAESARAQVAAGFPTGTLEQANAQLRRLSTESLLPLCPLARAQSPAASPPTPPTTTGTPGESEGPPTVTALSPPPPEPGTDCRLGA
jgi:serine/threonine protein kinase